MASNSTEKILVTNSNGDNAIAYGSFNDKVRSQAQAHKQEILQKAAEKVEKAAIKVANSNWMNEWYRKWKLSKAKKRYEKANKALQMLVY